MKLFLEGGITGQFYNSNILVKINSDGSLDNVFGTNGIVNHSYPRVALEVQLDGKIILGGTKLDRKSTRLNSSHVKISYAVFCLKKKKLCEEQRDKTVMITTTNQDAFLISQTTPPTRFTLFPYTTLFRSIIQTF